MDRTHVIVGASLAGATAAITLREEGADGRVVLIGAEPEPPYERPRLSKAYLRGEAPLEKALVKGLDVVAIDPSKDRNPPVPSLRRGALKVHQSPEWTRVTRRRDQKRMVASWFICHTVALFVRIFRSPAAPRLDPALTSK